MSVRIGLFVGLSLLATIGLLYLGLGVIPKAARNLPRTKWGGILFFLSDATINVDRVVTVLGNKRAQNHIASWHAIAFHAGLVAGIWLLITGLYLEYVRWGPWRRPSQWEESEIKAEIERRWLNQDRRKGSDPNYTGPERRSGPARRTPS